MTDERLQRAHAAMEREIADVIAAVPIMNMLYKIDDTPAGCRSVREAGRTGPATAAFFDFLVRRTLEEDRLSVDLRLAFLDAATTVGRRACIAKPCHCGPYYIARANVLLDGGEPRAARRAYLAAKRLSDSDRRNPWLMHVAAKLCEFDGDTTRAARWRAVRDHEWQKDRAFESQLVAHMVVPQVR
jgi:hypothetical protein